MLLLFDMRRLKLMLYIVNESIQSVSRSLCVAHFVTDGRVRPSLTVFDIWHLSLGVGDRQESNREK